MVGGREAAQGRAQPCLDTAGAAAGGGADRCTQEADDEEVDGSVRCSNDQGTAKGAEAHQGLARPIKGGSVDLCAGRQSMKRPAVGVHVHQ